MKVTKISTTVINAALRNWVIVRVDTDEPGLYGLGEATVEFQTEAVVGAVKSVAPLIIGRDPLEIERNWQIVYRHPFFKGGVSRCQRLVESTKRSGIFTRRIWEFHYGELSAA